jgi:hypothetical protein
MRSWWLKEKNMSKIKLMKFEANKDNLLITIPKELLIHCAKNHPTEPINVIDIDDFSHKVLEELSAGLGSADSGLTGLQELLDKAMTEVTENYPYCAEFIE